MSSQQRQKVFMVGMICFMLLHSLSWAGTIDLPRTGQIVSYDANTPQRDDGAIQTGVVLPNPRFTDNGDETVKDNLTGLEWTKDANAPGPTACGPGTTNTWQGALDYVACLNTSNYLNHSDWRLPNINELESLVDLSQTGPALPAGHPFVNAQSNYYWSSSTYAYDTSRAWDVIMVNSDVNVNFKTNSNYVWPVRSGQCGPGNSVICLSKTGQTTSYATGDDGDLQTGVVWPSPRFTDNSNETVTDNMTGLEWTKDANAPGPTACGLGTSKTWQGALDYVACLNTNSYFGHNDWRLPDRKELYSLVDRSKYNPAIPAGHPFTSVQSDFYWSSTTDAYDTDGAWGVDMYYCNLGTGYKGGGIHYVWPVRSGQSGSSGDSCTYIFAQQSKLFTYKSSNGTSRVTATGTDCAWTATSDSDWLTITSGSSGTDNGTVNYSVTANTGTTTRTGHITVDDQSFTVTQTGGTPKISAPSSLNIGKVKEDVASAMKSITVKNTGTANLEISDVTLTGTNSSEFSYEKAGCDSVAPKGSCTISVTLTATSCANKSATLSITSNGATKPTTVKLTGTAVPPKISVPASLRFTATSTGSTSAPKTVTIKNTGISSLSVNDVTITGTNLSEFTLTNNCTQALAKNETCTVTVTFSPSARGNRSATLNIASNDPKKTTAILKLSGKGK